MVVRVRNFIVLAAVLAAIFVPVVISGFSEIKNGQTAGTDLEAAEHYMLAARRIPWRADLYELAGDHFYSAHEYIRAAHSYQNAFRKKALSPQGWVAWGDVHFLNGEFDEAIAIWQEAVDRKISSDLLLSRLAVTYEREGDFVRALDAASQYIEAQPEDAPARYQLGLLLMLTDPVKGSEELITASLLDPEFDPAAQTLRTAVNLSLLTDSPAEGKVILGRGLGLVNEWALARALFEEAVHLDSQNAEAWAWLGEANQHTGRGDALTNLDQAVRLDPESSVIRSLRGLYFQRVENYREALVEFKEAARLDPENPEAFVTLGNAYENAGDLIYGLESLRYATSLAPEDPKYWEALARFCARNNSNVADVGIPAAQKAVVLLPDDPAALDLLGWLLTLDGREIEAEQLLQRALAADPDNASVYVHLALLSLQRDDLNAMYGFLVQARDLGSPEADALLLQYFP